MNLIGKEHDVNKKKIVIIGGVAAGPKVGSRINRLDPQAQITLIEKGEHLSYAGCGLPYYISGVVKNQNELMSTPIGVVRDTNFFLNVKNVQVLNQSEALSIDREKKLVSVKSLQTNETQSIEYDTLVLAIGAKPIKPPLAGIDLKNIFSLHTVEDAQAIKAACGSEKGKEVAIIGGGLIGLEMAEAFHALGAKVTIIEKLPQILSFLDKEMAAIVTKYLKQKGIEIKTNTTVSAFQGQASVEKVITDQGEVLTSLVVCAIGVRPNVELAQAAGLEIGEFRAIKVNELMQTSDPAIYAAGDCVQTVNSVTGKPCYVPLGSTANKLGRVAANNICGIKDVFPGVLKTAICKVFDYGVATTGLSEREALSEGYALETVLSPAPDRAHFYPSAKPIMMKLLVDKKSRQLLGCQIIGPGDVDKRIDIAVTAISAKMTVDQIANLDLSYAPPYSAAMDNIITAANIARNKLDGVFLSISPLAVKDKMDQGDDFIFLDVRSAGEVEMVHIDKTVHIPLGKLRFQTEQLARDKEIIVFCKISLRGYEAALILKSHGFENVKVMDGGILMWPGACVLKN